MQSCVCRHVVLNILEILYLNNIWDQNIHSIGICFIIMFNIFAAKISRDCSSILYRQNNKVNKNQILEQGGVGHFQFKSN